MFSSNTSAVSGDVNYIEDVFSTYLYTGNGSTQTITNGIDLSTKGGLVWIKNRSSAYTHVLVDTNRGTDKVLCSNNTNAEQTGDPGFVTQFNSNGFAIGDQARVNLSSSNFVSWTFRKQAKFFDVVTWTGDGTGTRNIAHALASTPGAIFIKQTSSNTSWINWYVYHRANTGTPETAALFLNTTDATAQPNSYLASTAPTSTQFTVTSGLNESSKTYVAYLFAHNAGGFGLTGTDNVISCGSYTGTGAAGNAITLGYEPQWLLIKSTDSTSHWAMFNNMMGMTLTDDTYLWANLASIENTYNVLAPTATGFVFQDPYLNASGGTYIYIAIRRGPMKTPTTGTSVFSPVARSGTGSTTAITTPGFAPDALFSSRTRNSGGYYVYGTVDKLRGAFGLEMTDTVAENAFSANSDLTGWSNVGYGLGPNSGSNLNQSGLNYIDWVMQRAPGFFDVVCYTGTGSSRAQAHNLGVAPELIIARSRDPGSNWQVFYSFGGSTFLRLILNTTAVASTESYGVQLSSAPTASNINLGASFPNSAEPVVQYLFASCPGVSKVGSYTGTGSTLQIDCGFTGGARFVLIKRTDSTGDWYVWDSARGIVAGNDPYLRLNSRAAEVTNTDYVDTYSAGFEISSTAPAAINANGGTFVFLAVA